MKQHHSLLAVLLVLSFIAVIPAYSAKKPSSRKEPAKVVDYQGTNEQELFAKGYVYIDSFDRKERLGDPCWAEKEKCSCPTDATSGTSKIMKDLPKDAAKAGADIVAVRSTVETETISKDFKCKKWGAKRYETASRRTECDPPHTDSRGNYHSGGCRTITQQRDVTPCLQSETTTGYQCQAVVKAVLYRNDPEMHAAKVRAAEQAEAERAAAREKAEAEAVVAREKAPIYNGLQFDYKWLNEGMFVKGPDGKLFMTPDGKVLLDKELIVDFTLKNLTKTRLKNVIIECIQDSRNWGSVKATYTIPELEPDALKEFKNVNLGKKQILRDDRSCKVKDFTIVRE